MTQQNENYSFDGVGNRLNSQISTTYQYAAFNRLTNTQQASYVYDANGNMVTKTDQSGVTQYIWDYENRLRQVIKPDSTTVNYKYDALGRRSERSVGATWTKFTYDGQDVILDVNSDGSTVKYLNGLGIDDKLSLKSNGQTLYFAQDHLGSTNALTDASGNVTSSASYDSFGNATGNLATRYAYTGREYDADTGLYYYRARFYDAKLGRFISEDPIGLSGGINQFGYVSGNPLNLSDPSGLDPDYDDKLWRAQQDLIIALESPIKFGMGFGDYTLFGLAKYFRPDEGESLQCSWEYQAGEWTAFAIQVAEGGIGLYRAGVSILTKYSVRKIATATENQGGRVLFDNWYKGTFPNRTQSVVYHVGKHGKGRTAVQYTQDAMDFFNNNKALGKSHILKDGTSGLKIQTKQIVNGKTVKVGGYWTDTGKIVTFWD